MATPAQRLVKPEWIRVRVPGGDHWQATRKVLKEHGIVTVCREAVCPNQAECWQNKTATFMIGGDTCTRGCRFCAVATAKSPAPPDPTEPQRVARAARDLETKFAVVTSVDRDDLDDYGAGHWAATIRALRNEIPGVRIETLVPDFRGNTECLQTVLDARPDVLSHNLETVPRLYPTIRPGATTEWSLRILRYAADNGFVAKTGLMLGLGETNDEVLAFLEEAADTGLQIVTLGQYLQPTRRHAPVKRFVSPDEFLQIGEQVRALGVPVVEAGPLVRSSYHAHKHADALGIQAPPELHNSIG